MLIGNPAPRRPVHCGWMRPQALSEPPGVRHRLIGGPAAHHQRVSILATSPEVRFAEPTTASDIGLPPLPC